MTTRELGRTTTLQCLTCNQEVPSVQAHLFQTRNKDHIVLEIEQKVKVHQNA